MKKLTTDKTSTNHPERTIEQIQAQLTALRKAEVKSANPYPIRNLIRKYEAELESRRVFNFLSK